MIFFKTFANPTTGSWLCETVFRIFMSWQPYYEVPTFNFNIVYWDG
jgi:hypothetical protein